MGDDATTSGLMLGAFGALLGFSVSSLVNYNFGDSEALMMLLFVIGRRVVEGKRKAKAKGKNQKAKVKEEGSSNLIFAF